MTKYYKFLLVLLFFSSICKNVYAELEVNAEYAILQDHLSGEVLYEKNPDSKIYPASMTKIMTAIVVFDLIKSGEVSLDEEFIISEKAWRMSQSGYSSMFIMLNDKISVEDLLKGVIIVSGNDACVALAEGVSGSEEDFVILMNNKAMHLGLKNTNFANSSGINNVYNYSTVRDILIMSRYMILNYPEFYTYFKETTFTWDRTGGDPITQGNRNPLLYKNIGADGIKTGFLTVEKYSLASSLLSGERRINAVVSGFNTKNERSRGSIKFLNWALNRFDTIRIAKKDEPITTFKVWLGKENYIEAITNRDFYLTVAKRKKKSIQVVAQYKSPIIAPIKEGDKIGILNIYENDELVDEMNLFAKKDIKRSNIFSRILTSFNYLIWGDV